MTKSLLECLPECQLDIPQESLQAKTIEILTTPPTSVGNSMCLQPSGGREQNILRLKPYIAADAVITCNSTQLYHNIAF